MYFIRKYDLHIKYHYALRNVRTPSTSINHFFTLMIQLVEIFTITHLYKYKQ